MNLLFDIGHPGQVHLFKDVIRVLNAKGNNVVVTVKDIAAAKELLESFQIPYISLGSKFNSLFLKGLSQLRYDLRLFRIARRNNTDIAVGSSITIAHVSMIHKLKSIILDDDDAEAVKLFSLFAHPFADCILSPFPLEHQRKRKKELTYLGTHELFYLHPSHFQPDPSILDELQLQSDEVFFVVRFVKGKAYHDKGEQWMTNEQKLRILSLLDEYGRVFLTSEDSLEDEFQKWKLNINPEKIHQLMYYATMFVGDSQTMTSEAAILGTPALKCNSFAHRLSIPNTLEDIYGLCYSFLPSEFELMLEKMQNLLDQSDLKTEWIKRREHFLNDTINPSRFLIWFIENFPKSISIVEKDYQYQKIFQ